MDFKERIADADVVATAWGEAKKKLPPAQAQELGREIFHIINVALIMQDRQEGHDPEIKAG